MLPGVLAQDIRQALAAFLRQAFPFANAYFQQPSEPDQPPTPQALINSLVDAPGQLFKGPYLELKRPFRKAPQTQLPFARFDVPFVPHKHQLLAFERLVGEAGKPTLVATGTGSGKTECFMYPVLEYCLQRREQGIKAIIIYPMNALADDQAKRLAKEIDGLDTQLTAGLFVGHDLEGDKQGATSMGPESVITCHKTLRKNPPDILLTNYKMLDFLLIRPVDQPLWRYNSPGLLRYLVVDELHSFDGAQGTDLACLIRRLRHRLRIGDELLSVGTSATIGADNSERLRRYASDVFACHFDEDSVIVEDRLGVAEYLAAGPKGSGVDESNRLRYFSWPDRHEKRLNPALYASAEDYLYHQARLWFDEGLSTADVPALNARDEDSRNRAALALGELLHQHIAFEQLLKACESICDVEQLLDEWQALRGMASREHTRWLLLSLLSLISAARVSTRPESEAPELATTALLDVRLQLWVRELKRLVATVPGGSEAARLTFADDITDPNAGLALPVLHCRECHFGAWGAVSRKGSQQLDPDLNHFYEAWFSRSPSARLLVPCEDETAEGVNYLCANCQHLQMGLANGQCAECGSDQMRPVTSPDRVRQVTRKGVERHELSHDCPDCGARDALMVVGYQAASLASVMAGRLFHSRFNDDHKLIAFSDSVQDAAHRAGFIEANTWRQVLRQAMHHWLVTQPLGVTLADMHQMMPRYWRGECASTTHFVALFIAHNMAWHPDYDRLLSENLSQLPAQSPLGDWVEKRLSWECVAEFGRRSQIGRSLERAGLAAVGFDETRMVEVTTALCRQLREELGTLREITEPEVERFLVGVLYRMRLVGAIDHPALGGYLREGGKEYLLNKLLPWMPNYGRSRRPPAAITLRNVAPNFEPLINHRQGSWALGWLKKTLGSGQSLFAASDAEQVFALTLDLLARNGLLVEYHWRDNALWMLAADKLQVEADVVQLRCQKCRHGVTVTRASHRLYQSLPCLRLQCPGELALDATASDTESRQPPVSPRRLVPHEHTGLLTRERREQVEKSFKQGSDPWNINVLSATPTLEMGIDIGSLSSVLLCSVPPSQANYLQRIGRAGRRDGNALAITIANGQAHDLYFYSDPMEMIAGHLEPPGVFLQAMAVLERQLLAFCLDCWARTEVGEQAIPGRMSRVLGAIERRDEAQFPYNLLAFMDDQASELLAGFVGMFDGLSDNQEGRAYLARALDSQEPKSVGRRVVERLTQMLEQQRSLQRNADTLKKRLAQLQRRPDDDAVENERESIRRERQALLALIRQRSMQNTLNFFTDEGLLPNYAFPEEGVTLQSVILRRLEGVDSKTGKGYEKKAYAFQRPAQSALSELAPESRFYAVSHEMEVEQIDLDLEKPQYWRFCDRCHHSECIDEADDHSACPKCGSPQWADSGQRHAVLRLRQVYSTVDARKGRIGDESENRVPTFFNRQMLVSIPERAQSSGFRLKGDDLPFGFEFVDRVELKEINFGPRGQDTNVFSVAGQELARQGFPVCRSCGKVQKDPAPFGYEPHAFSCEFRQNPEKATDEDFFRSLYLFRQLESEAIRILLPLSEVAYSDEKLNSFVAALNMGLKAYFHGDVSHLQVTQMQEPASESSAERLFLVVYDRIPGGTGYLKELMRSPDQMFEVLELARQRLRHCECVEDETRDGCYRCLLAYRESRNMRTISRRAAEQLLGEILERREHIEVVQSLDSITTNTLVESKLEQRFIDALAALPGASLTPQRIKGRNGYLLNLPGRDGNAMAWLVEHQVNEGPKNGVALNTAIDVVLTPARSQQAERYRSIAVYLDGLQYHHDRVDDDVCKRLSLWMSGRYWVYTLTWDDIATSGRALRENSCDLMALKTEQHTNLVELFDGQAKKHGWLRGIDHTAHSRVGSMRHLEALLRAPEMATSDYRQRGVYRGWTAARPARVRDEGFARQVQSELLDCAPQVVRGEMVPDEGEVVLGGFNAVCGGREPLLDLFVSFPLSGLKAGSLDALAQQMRLHLCFDDTPRSIDDEFKAAWRAFWSAVNQWQFFEGFSLATRGAIANGALDDAWHRAVQLRQALSKADDIGTNTDDWQEVVELTEIDPAFIQQIVELGCPVPVVGFDICSEDGEVLLGGDVVELAWPDRCTAIVLGELPGFEVPGWRLLRADGELIAELKPLFFGEN